MAFEDSFPPGITQSFKYSVLFPLTPNKSALSSEFLSVRLQPKLNPGPSPLPLDSFPRLTDTARPAATTPRAHGPRGGEGARSVVEQDPVFLRGHPLRSPACAHVRAWVEPELDCPTQASERRSQRVPGHAPAGQHQAGEPSKAARPAQSVGRLCCGNTARCHGNSTGASPVPPWLAGGVSQTRLQRAGHVRQQPGFGGAFGLRVLRQIPGATAHDAGPGGSHGWFRSL